MVFLLKAIFLLSALQH